MELFFLKKKKALEGSKIKYMVHTVIIFLQGTKVFSWCKMDILKFDDKILKETSIVIVVLSSF